MPYIFNQIQRIRKNWDELAKRDPLWAILTDPEHEQRGWERDLDTFFKTGRSDVKMVVDDLVRFGQTLPLGEKGQDLAVLDYGCGAGRLTAALTDYFSVVHAIDVSEMMLSRLASYLHQKWFNSFSSVVIQHTSDDPPLIPLKGGTVSFVLSLLTLQHNPPLVQAFIIAEFMRVLKKDGIAYFNAMLPPLVPFNQRPGDDPENNPVMEMYGIEPTGVIAEARAHGGKLIQFEYDRGNSVWSPAWVSVRYTFRKVEAEA